MTIRRGTVLVAPAIALFAVVVSPAAAGSRTLIVDDDKQQCPNAAFTSINAAITAAAPGDQIRVCPGLYSEVVIVDKPGLSLRGSTNGSTTEPCLRGDDASNPARDTVINGAVQLEANNVLLEAFTVQGAPIPPEVFWPAGISTGFEFSGYVITRNVVQNNPTGINLKSNGVEPTVVTQNCIRSNNIATESALPLGIVSEQGLLVNARIESNTFTGHEFGSMFLGYGLVAFPVITAPNTDLTVTHNVSVNDGVSGITVSNVARVEISHNKLTRTGNGIQVFPPASDAVVLHNQVEESPFTGIRIDGNPFGCCFFPSGPTNVTVAHNHVAAAGTSAPQDGIAVRRSRSITVVDNLVERNTRDGISVRDSTDNVVSRNQADDNVRDGIRSRGTTSATTFEGNHMRRNAEHDAHDENRAANTWVGNHCETDFPPGTICGQ